MHGNDMQMRLCLVKLGVVSSIYGYFWEESGWRCVRAIFPWLGFIKGFLLIFWRTHAFINLKTFVRTQNLAFVRAYTFRSKSTMSIVAKMYYPAATQISSRETPLKRA